MNNIIGSNTELFARLETGRVEARRWVHRSYVVFGLAVVFPVTYAILGGYPVVDHYRWWLIGAYIVLFAIGCALIHKSRLITARLMRDARAAIQNRPA